MDEARSIEEFLFAFEMCYTLEGDSNLGTSIIARRRALTRLATHSDTQHRQVNRRPAIQIGDSHRIAHSLFCSCCCATKRALVLAFGDVFLLLLAAIHKSVAKAQKMYKKWRGSGQGRRKKRDAIGTYMVWSRVVTFPIQNAKVKHVIDVSSLERGSIKAVPTEWSNLASYTLSLLQQLNFSELTATTTLIDLIQPWK